MSCDCTTGPLEISSPGARPGCVIGVEALVGTLDVLADVPTFDCDENGITVDDEALTTDWVTIGTQRFRPGQAFTFTLVCDDGVDDGDYELELAAIVSEDGYETTATKTVRVATPEA